MHSACKVGGGSDDQKTEQMMHKMAEGKMTEWRI
jgi:hypothetical protein